MLFTFKSYDELTQLTDLLDRAVFLAKLKDEHGASGTSDILNQIEVSIGQSIEQLEALPNDPALELREPDDLESIRALRPSGPRVMMPELSDEAYREKLEGALLARLAGCALGGNVEGQSLDGMEDFAQYIGDVFPPVDHWSASMAPSRRHYIVNRGDDLTRDKMDGAPSDDDITYTLTGLMLLEKYGHDFRSEDIAHIWHEYLPWIWKDVKTPMDRYLSGISADAAADNTPYVHCIGASTRCDPYGYAAPGHPELAAEMSYRESYMTHRRNGIYGAMFFGAAIAAAFCVDHPREALEIGLTEIPKESQFAQAIRWALDIGDSVKNYRDGRAAVDEYLGELNHWHVTNNACLTTLGLLIGGTDVTKVLGETAAMGMDNDCTAATAGSIVGAIVGRKGVPEHWYRNFHNRIHSHINGIRYFAIDDVVERFLIQKKRIVG